MAMREEGRIDVGNVMNEQEKNQIRLEFSGDQY
jgi:hypothetical protein